MANKNIVICCDGTGNEFGESSSNVVKLCKVLVQSEAQVCYYHPGVGTIGARNALTSLGKWWTKVIGLAFGYGVSENIADAYQFLMKTFEPGDRIYVFGFSRGAYTVRALCGMVHVVGLLEENNEGLIPFAVRMIKKKNIDFAVAADFKKTFSRECRPHFVGAWDTVSSLGWVYDTLHFPFTRLSRNADLQIVRHAMSIDERRAFFRQNLLGPAHDASQDVKEIWFAGVHSDVGGSYPESQSGLSKVAFKWMLEEAESAGLKVDPERKAAILGGNPHYVAPDSRGRQHESLRGAWWIAEIWPKIVHGLNKSGEWRSSIRFNLGRRRLIAPGCVVHPSVEERMKDESLHYRPSNLPAERQAAV